MAIYYTQCLLGKIMSEENYYVVSFLIRLLSTSNPRYRSSDREHTLSELHKVLYSNCLCYIFM